MIESATEALIDSLKLLPVLFIVYIVIELVEHRYIHKIKDKLASASRTGPVIGALAGIVPQCGFSVISSALYSKKYITLGTLMAVFVATSDEAVPVILSDLSKASLVLPIIVSKLIIALIFGLIIDLVLKKNKSLRIGNNDCIPETGCCGHSPDSDKLTFKEIFYHPFTHTAKIFVYIFLITVILNLLMFYWGELYLNHIFLTSTILQPVAAAVFGLVPNCAVSVAITKLYLEGTISFGSTISGLSSGAGLGLLVLWRENPSKKDTLKIIFLLAIISSIVGILIQYFYG